MLRPAAPLLVAILLAAGVASAAHHGSADYHTDREIAVAGVVAGWRWVQPHTRITLTVRTPDGRTESWEGEGPPLTWAEQRGWSRTTLRSGEPATLVMYPSRSSPRAGLIKRIERPGRPPLPVTRPWLGER